MVVPTSQSSFRTYLGICCIIFPRGCCKMTIWGVSRLQPPSLTGLSSYSGYYRKVRSYIYFLGLVQYINIFLCNDPGLFGSIEFWLHAKISTDEPLLSSLCCCVITYLYAGEVGVLAFLLVLPKNF